MPATFPTWKQKPSSTTPCAHSSGRTRRAQARVRGAAGNRPSPTANRPAAAIDVALLRAEPGGRPPGRAVPGERRRDVPVGPLSVATLHGILKQQFQHSLPRPVMVRIVAACGGNPFYALETVAAALDAATERAARRVR